MVSMALSLLIKFSYQITQNAIGTIYIFKFLINLIQLNKSLNNINLKIISKIFSGKFYRLIHLDTIDTNGYGFIYINSISKFQ